jgi:hypothetical protein
VDGWVSKTPFLPHTPSLTMPKFLCPHKCPYNALTMHAPYNVLTMPSPMHVLTMPSQCPNNALTMPLKMHLQCSHNAPPNRQQSNPSYNALAMTLKCSSNALTMLLQCTYDVLIMLHEMGNNTNALTMPLHNTLVMLLQCTCKCLIMLHKIRQQTQLPLLQMHSCKCPYNVVFIMPSQNGQQTTQSLNYSLFTYYLLLSTYYYD